ncbi:leucine-rich repeat transmembrane protein FLRT3-like [Lineus longissimus]|uniref:leucine-rich repeat transmembrane protein FLRT3-like n=1 Tax=Lineus longissimus TaxID=88925 RepID=UPI00315C61B4
MLDHNRQVYCAGMDHQNDFLTSLATAARHGDTVKSIIMQGGKVGNIPKQSFEGFETLENLTLTDLNISHIAPGTFKRLTGLKLLKISKNLLETIPSQLPSSLVELNLEDNVLGLRDNDVNWDSLHGLVNLCRLIMPRNYIRTLPPNVFAKCINLRTLDLSEGSVTTVLSGAFNGLTNLITLQLSHSKLKHIDGAAFTDLQNVKVMNYSHSQMFSITSGIIDKLSEYALAGVEIDLSGNPWSCSCHMRRTKEKLLALGRRNPLSRSMKCQTPPEVHGKRIIMVSMMHFRCVKPKFPPTCCFTNVQIDPNKGTNRNCRAQGLPPPLVKCTAKEDDVLIWNPTPKGRMNFQAFRFFNQGKERVYVSYECFATNSEGIAELKCDYTGNIPQPVIAAGNNVCLMRLLNIIVGLLSSLFMSESVYLTRLSA